MPKSIKLKDNTYLDSSSISHNKKPLNNILDNLYTFNNYRVEVGSWYNKTLYRISRSIEIVKGNNLVLQLEQGATVKMCNAWLYKKDSDFDNLVNWNADTKGKDFGVLYYNHQSYALFMNSQENGWLQLVIYYTIE